jgi:hypothetical protein
MSFAKITGWDESKVIAAMKGADAPLAHAARRKRFQCKTVSGLASATRANAVKCQDRREAHVLGLEADAHTAKAAVLGAEAAMLAGELVSNVLGDDSKLGTWTIMGRMDFVGKAADLAKQAAMSTPTGMQIQAGRKVFKMAQKNPAVRGKVAHIAKKAQKGDKKSQQDLAAIKAGAAAEAARKKAAGKHLAMLRADERAKRKKAHKARFTFFKFGPHKIFGRPKKSNVTRLASAQKILRDSKSKNPIKRRRAQRDIKVIHAAAKAGNPHAKKAVRTFFLASKLQAKKTKSQKRQFNSALHLVRAAKGGSPSAKQQIAIYHAAASQGDPHARAVTADLKLAAQTERFISGGPAPEVHEPSALRHNLEMERQAARLADARRERRIAEERGPDVTPKPKLPVPESMKRPKDMPKKTEAATAQAAAAMGVPAVAAVAVIAKAKAGDPTAKSEMKAADAVYMRAQAGDPAAKAAIAQAAQGYKKGDPVVASRAAALAAVVGIRKGAKPTPARRVPAPRQPIADFVPITERPTSALIQFGTIPHSPFRNYFRGIRQG